MKKALMAFYLDWVNNYLTREKMAEHYEFIGARVQPVNRDRGTAAQ